MIVQELVATLGLEIDEQTFNRALLVTKGLALGLAGIGAAVGSAVVGLGALVNGTAEAAAEVKNLATTANVGTDFFQGLAYAAREVGFDIDDLRDVFLDVSERASDAKDGAEEYATVYKALGVTVTDANGKLKDGETLLREIADGFAAMPEGTRRAALASKLLGETGARMLPVLLKGSKGLDEYTASAREAGFIIGGETIQAATEFRAQSVLMTATLEGLRNEIGGALMPAFTEAIKVVSAWIRENKKLISGAVIGFFKAMASSVTFVKRNLTLLKGALLLVASFMFASYMPLLGTVTAMQVQFGLAALISGARAAAGWALMTAASWLALAPVALLAAGIFLLYDELITFSEGGDTLLGRFINWLDKGEDSGFALLDVFKAFGSVLFDLTNGAKWEKFGRLWLESFLWPMEKVRDLLLWIGNWIANQPVVQKVLGFVDAGFAKVDSVLKKGEALVSGVRFTTGGIGEDGQTRTLGEVAKGVKDFAGRIQFSGASVGGEAPRLRTVSELYGMNSASPAASLAASPQAPAPSVYSPTVTAEVNVTVGDNASPRQTGEAVAEAVTGEWWGKPDFSANLVAVDQ